jgi:L-malate glycosyltransferase
VTIPNCIRRERVASVRGRREVRHELGFADDTPLLCHVANLRQAKAQDQLLRAFAMVQRSFPASRLLMVGAGPLESDLRELAHRLDLAEQVVFLGGRSDVPDLLAASDLFVLSSSHEGLPITILEAMAAGRPVVTTDVGGCAEAVEHEATGFVVPPAAPERLAGALVNLLQDPRRARQMGEAGRQRVATLFSPERFLEQHTRLYERAWARERGRP